MTAWSKPAAHADGATRRRLFTVAAAAAALGKSAFAGGDDISHTAESIHQEPAFQASRNRVYAALTDAREFNEVMRRSDAMRSMALQNSPPKITPQAGGAFSLFGGHIVGRNIELVPSERIVQAWRVVDWNAGVYSIARFELTADGSGTKIIFDHTGFPVGQAEHLAAGWIAHYWKPLMSYLS
ncbi:MAG TPA: SRPBCC domain-containing protein [Bryobacteraceae bacterium]|nr:SRPBCC domain-containing protein [Bryobacteraceae bacterium]